GDGDGGGCTGPAPSLAKGQRLRRDREIIAAIGLDPKANLFGARLIEMHIDGHRLAAGKARGVHGGLDGRLLARIEPILESGGADATTGDADMADVDHTARVVFHMESVLQRGTSGYGAEVLGKLSKQAVSHEAAAAGLAA